MGSVGDPKPVVTGYPAAPPGGATYPYPVAPPPPAPFYAAPHPAPPAAYYAPQPQPAYYNTYSSNPLSRNSTLLRRLIAVTIGVFLFMGAATLILWLVLRPRIPEFAVSSAAVSAFNLSSSSAHQLSADFDLTLSVRNPNEKMSVSYDHLSAGVLYGTNILAETSLAPFEQAKGNNTVVRARMAAVAEYVEDFTSERITADRADGDGAVDFRVSVYGWVTFRAGAWRTRRHVMRVYCEGVRIGFNNSTAGVGALVGPPKQCRVSL